MNIAVHTRRTGRRPTAALTMPAPKTKLGAAEAEQHNDPDHGTFVAPPV
jgi:hypothetical protein